VNDTDSEPIRPVRPLIPVEAAIDPAHAEPLGPAALIAAARRGDRDAFGRLVEPELATALGACQVLTRSHADAADAVQDALLSAWRGLDSLRDPLAFRAWFRRHVVRAAIRITKRRPRVVELAMDLPAPAGELERTVERRLLARGFDRLSADDRVLLTLRHLWDLPVAEAAALLAIPQGTVKSRTSAAMERLRAAYDAETRR
jgi:RNA polymerase sigma-70 factor (ECF subfamily)